IRRANREFDCGAAFIQLRLDAQDVHARRQCVFQVHEQLRPVEAAPFHHLGGEFGAVLQPHGLRLSEKTVQLLPLRVDLRYLVLYFLRARAQIRIRLAQRVKSPAENGKQKSPHERGNRRPRQERAVAHQWLRRQIQSYVHDPLRLFSLSSGTTSSPPAPRVPCRPAISLRLPASLPKSPRLAAIAPRT